MSPSVPCPHDKAYKVEWLIEQKGNWGRGECDPSWGRGKCDPGVGANMTPARLGSWMLQRSIQRVLEVETDVTTYDPEHLAS